MITSEEQLRQLYAMPAERALLKQQVDLDRHCLRFIALSPFCVIATGGNAGSLMDASPRGGAPGFVKAPDPRTLMIPDAGGNNRLDSLSNLLRDPRIGLLFMVPGINETLRVNGTAKLRDEGHYTALFAGPHFHPKLVIEVQVQEAYLHCAKALMRSRLWQAEAQVARNVLPTMNQMIHAQIGMAAPTETQEQMEHRYRVQIAAEQPGGSIG
ncbi:MULTISPECIES: pyridoxamine 5'-phosphate oxidase family protein [Comamonas]|uniref:pyridoxamine 5'-phosphate oxidase family protein n=1 Tax=Comamonas TaxID=283 RepID=UPI001B722699|nr:MULTISPECIES: pyridoxamine 5'-phosphate oxidase family protein [Comamonas]MBP7353385.1 pyridoxamine 5'-phosphate oxidase family protein [Comamonas sp.]MBV7418935.1 pyridoxamine 5'-phosphate oxidase family protein [Comamonas sp. CMM03]MDH0048156.1 pyridoxamine 5'-phosphate oxidase family protein [Comamonas terrigena]MDH0510245.1 pyridoxamine 5'-phosphate oxidase family protein [Comamonas terrigena]MDH1089846.1 pyridoxamine 5'-phosphate oxidase family protein [Comamonas terrigena]